MSLRALAVTGLAAVASAVLATPAGAVSPVLAPRVTIALLPNGTSVEQVGRVRGISPGILSAGLGEVSPDQTYLDITQGNRVFDSLYDGDLPIVNPLGSHVPRWGEIVARADSAPADIVPGLMASSLEGAGFRDPRGAVEATPELVLPALLAADRAGRIGRLPAACEGGCPRLGAQKLRYAPQTRHAAPVAVVNAEIPELPELVRALRGRDLLIALERPPPEERGQLAVGIAGAGFEGNLTSDSTRIDGYVLSTDIAPTILERLGVGIPSEISGEPIRAEGSPDAADVVSLEDRLGVIEERRGPVIGVSLLAWLIVAGAAAALTRGAAARLVLQLLALACVYLPFALLITAALEPGEGVERLIVLLGAPSLAAATLAPLGGYRALAAASAVTVLACAVDVIAGSPLTSLSLIGPNPGGGVRFFGIGNELEAALAPLILVGTGAAITSLRPGLPPRRCAIAFFAVALPLALVFGSGRFGADVGAAIVLPIGAAVAAAAIGAPRRAALLVVAVPLLVLAALAALDLALGGNAHLTRSVLDAGGLHDLADVAERRLRLSARSFARAASTPIFYLVLVAVAVGVYQRHRLRGWFEGRPIAWAGYAGAIGATLVGMLANDSGALLLEIGAAYLLVFAGFAWAQASPGTAQARNPPRAAV